MRRPTTRLTFRRSIERPRSASRAPCTCSRRLRKRGCRSRRVWVVTQRAVSADGLPDLRRKARLAQAPVWGLGRTIALEHPELWGGLIDVSHDDVRSAAQALAVELERSRDGDDQVALTPQRPLRRRVSSGRSAAVGRSSPTSVPSARATDLPRHRRSGRARAARRAMARRAARDIWCSRAGVRRWMTAPATTIAALERAGATVSIVAADVSKPADVDSAAGPDRGRPGAAARNRSCRRRGRHDPARPR